MPTKHESNILKDKVIICTYPQKEQDELYDMLTALGATVLSMPMIEISPLPFQLENTLTTYDWLVFTSKNAVQPFVSQFKTIKNKVAALGEQTANRLRQSEVEPDFVGTGKSAADFINELLPVLLKNEKVLLVLGNLAPNTLQQQLKEKALVDRINVYQTEVAKSVDQKILRLVKNDQYDVLIVTSPSAINGLISKLNIPHHPLRIISIGITTTAAIGKFQIEPVATAIEPSYKGLAQTTIDYMKNDLKKLKI